MHEHRMASQLTVGLAIMYNTIYAVVGRGGAPGCRWPNWLGTSIQCYAIRVLTNRTATGGGDDDARDYHNAWQARYDDLGGDARGLRIRAGGGMGSAPRCRRCLRMMSGYSFTASLNERRPALKSSAGRLVTEHGIERRRLPRCSDSSARSVEYYLSKVASSSGRPRPDLVAFLA
jgi:hypothetical protein